MEFENNTVQMQNPAEVKAPENVLLGIVGAFVGALIGGASIVLLSQIGYVASISGLILAVCTQKGYELLAKGLSGKGIAISVILMLVTPFLADWIDWALLIMQEWSAYGVTFSEAFWVMPELLKDGSIEMSQYLGNLGMIYLFVLLGAVYTVKDALKRNKK